MLGLVLNQNEQLLIALSAAIPPANSFAFVVSYTVGDGVMGKRESKEITINVDGSDTVVLNNPGSAKFTITNFSVRNRHSGTITLIFKKKQGVNAAVEIDRQSLLTGERLTERAQFDANGAMKNVGTAGTNAVLTRTSTSPNTIGAGAKIFTYANTTNLGWAAGDFLLAVDNANTNNYMFGRVGLGNVTGTQVTIDVAAGDFSGSGSISNWTIMTIGARGALGLPAILTASSTDAVLVGTGSKTFTFPTPIANLGYIANATRIRVANSLTTFMEGVVTAISTSGGLATGLTVNVDTAQGSGTPNAWNISIAGERGSQGPPGTGGSGSGLPNKRIYLTFQESGGGSNYVQRVIDPVSIRVTKKLLSHADGSLVVTKNTASGRVYHFGQLGIQILSNDLELVQSIAESVATTVGAAYDAASDAVFYVNSSNQLTKLTDGTFVITRNTVNTIGTASGIAVGAGRVFVFTTSNTIHVYDTNLTFIQIVNVAGVGFGIFNAERNRFVHVTSSGYTEIHPTNFGLVSANASGSVSGIAAGNNKYVLGRSSTIEIWDATTQTIITTLGAAQGIPSSTYISAIYYENKFWVFGVGSLVVIDAVTNAVLKVLQIQLGAFNYRYSLASHDVS